jgi:putative ABC transport system permease protein
MNAFRWAARQLARNPVFSAIVISTLALGIGASTLIFSVLDGVLLRPLPYPDADRVVRVYQINEGRGNRGPVSDPNFTDLKDRSRSFSAFAQFGGVPESVAGGSEPVRLLVSRVSRGFYEAIGVQPLYGRVFTVEESTFGAAPVAAVSYAYWQRYLGGAPDFASRPLRIGGREYSVVGVMPPGFDYPDGAQVWTPREMLGANPERTAHNLQAVGRLADGVTLEQARAELTSIAGALKAEHGANTWMTDAALVPIHENLVGNVRPGLLVLGAAVALLFVVAWTNVASMLLTRAVTREQELAVRVALGASGWRLARQFLTETLLLCGIGGVLGLAVAWFGLELLVALQAGSLPRADALEVEWLAVAFAGGVSLAAAVTLSLLLAWRATRSGATANANRRSAVGGARSKLREIMVGAQVAVALVLLVGAVLLGRSFVALTQVDPGFRTDDLLLMHVALPRIPVEQSAAPLATFHDELIMRVGALPGVASVGAITFPPLAGSPTSSGTLVSLNQRDEVRTFDDYFALSREPTRVTMAEFKVANDDYFDAFGIPLLRGRLFEQTDGPAAEHVGLVSRSLAESRWPGEDPIGKLVQFGGMDGDLTPFTVIGIVGDVHEFGVDTVTRPTFYGYYRQRPRVISSFWIAMRAANTESLIPAARQVLQAMNPDVAPQFRSADELFAQSLAQRRFNLTVLGVFGAAALLLALAGIYGAIAFHVAQRTQEIGVRMALGALGSSVVALIVRRSVLVAAAGVAVGLMIAAGAARLMGSLLYGVSPFDPVAYATAAGALLAAAAIASWLPAKRAARVDPITALRSE